MSACLLSNLIYKLDQTESLRALASKIQILQYPTRLSAIILTVNRHAFYIIFIT